MTASATQSVSATLLPQLSIAKMDPLSQVFCLRWNNHRNNLLTVFDHLLQTEAFCDVTLACDGASIKCHKMILSACSSYFQTLFMENTCEHPIVFLKDIKYDEIRAILDYMYKGEVNVAQDQLPGLLKVAELLKVKGLVEEEREKLLNSGRKEGRPVVTTSDVDERPRSSASSAKLNVNGDVKDSPPASSSSASMPSIVRPFMYTPPAGGPQFPMWPLPGIFPGAHNLFAGANGRGGEGGKAGSSRDDAGEKEGSPSPKDGGSVGGAAKRKKTASGSGGSSSSKESGVGSLPPLIIQEPQGAPDLNRPHNDEKLQHLVGSDLNKDGGLLSLPPGLDKGDGTGGIANYVPNQRLEWKRYKQYTRNDIMAAIEEVKKGMSALQASRKYGVPSRTLYDKVKKMGITTGRQMQRKSLPQYPASFPSLGGMMNLESYKDMADRYKDMDDDNDSSHNGDDMDNRATLVPTGGGFPTLQMLNIMEKMKESERSGKDSEISLTPMNLSTMLSNSRCRDFGRGMGGMGGDGGEGHRGRLSDSSMSPNGDDDVDIDEEDDDGLDDDDEDDDDDKADGGEQRHRERHASADIRAQFMADLRRLGGNIPTQSSSSNDNENQQQTATSTTASPPPLLPTSSSSSFHRSHADDNLPPRKRKVSQEHRMAASASETTPGGGGGGGNHSSADERSGSSPFNGRREQDVDKRSPIKTAEEVGLQCRN